MEMGATVVLADAHAMVRAGMKLVLRETGRMTVVGETDSVEEAVRLSLRLNPDILAIDSGMLGGSGLRAIRKLRDNYRSAIRRKLGITTRAEFVSVALKAGFLDTDLPPST